MKPQTMAAAFVNCKIAHNNCVTNGNTDWEVRWLARLDALVQLIPSGSGIDRAPRTRSAVEIAADAIRFDVGFHHMNDVGMYDGWTEHTVLVRPAFDGITVRVSGRDRNGVKDYIAEVMEHAFTRHVTWDEPAQRWTVEADMPKPRWTRSETGRDLLRDGRFMASISRATERHGPALSPSESDALSRRIAELLTLHGDGMAALDASTEG